MNQRDLGDVKTRLAANLRRLRVARHLSLSQLARATATSKATLSAIESGRGNPTLDTLALLTAALGASVSELLDPTQLGEIRIVRASRAPTPITGVTLRRLDSTAGSSGDIEVLQIDLPPRHLHEQPAHPAGARQSLLVLKGKLIAGPAERISELASGDYASFPADVPHLYETAASAARVLVVTHSTSS